MQSEVNRTFAYVKKTQYEPVEQIEMDIEKDVQCSEIEEANDDYCNNGFGVYTRILIVEDDDDDYFLAREMITEARGGAIDIVHAPNVDIAESRISRESFDAIIVDFRLGGVSGLEFVRNSQRVGANCPFIVLTGENDRATDISALRAGAMDYLVKSEITPTLIDRSIRYSIERFQAERRLNRLAKFDQLTGLANRHLFQEFLKSEIKRCDEMGHCLALLLIDLNRFKQINDNYGHATGDQLLKLTAQRIKHLVRAGDLVARFGGDEFMVVLTEFGGVETARQRAEILYSELHASATVNGTYIEPSASIGMSLYPNEAKNLNELVISADAAMYAAKREPAIHIGRYTNDMRLSNGRKIKLEKNLRFAMKASQFELFYQPKMSFGTGRIVGAEALLRWNHPELGRISPNEFVGVAEENGSIHAIGEWVADQACKQLAEWRAVGIIDIHVAINVSARQLNDIEFADKIMKILKNYDLCEQMLEIEVTESSIINDSGRSFENLQSLVEKNVSVALDDFGTGYSSLLNLRSFRGKIIKIDKKFVENIGKSSRDESIIEALIYACKSMKLLTVAEGVETFEQWEFLKEKGCDIAQGFLISKPLVADVFAKWICEKRNVSEQPFWATDPMNRDRAVEVYI